MSLFLLIEVFLNFISDKLYPWFRIYNHFFINIIFLVQFGFLSLFYSYSFENKKWRNVVESILIIVVSYLLIKYLLFPDSFFVFHYQDIYITIFPIIVYSVMYLYNEYNSQQELYWANFAILTLKTILFFCYLTWPLSSIQIDYDYMNEFNDVVSDLAGHSYDVVYIVYSVILLFQLKKLKFQ